MPQIVCRHDITTRDGRWLQKYVHLTMGKLRDILQVRGDFFKHSGTTFLFWILGPLVICLCHQLYVAIFTDQETRFVFIIFQMSIISLRPCYPAQDYSEAATVHGVSYICQRDQSTFHRILWLVIFSMGVPKIVMMIQTIPICRICVSQLKPTTLYKLSSSPIFCCL